MTVLAALLYLVGLAVIFGVRTWLQIRRTGSSGFHGISGRPGSLRWTAGVLFVFALVLGAAAVVLAAVGAVAPPSGGGASVLAGAGVAVAVLGFAGVLAAQTAMGSSWRIGVDESERTALVTGGVFALVRNPIFTAIVTAQVGVTLMVPTWLSATALVCLVVAVELQVRLIEEPYLLQTHGPAYADYAAATGRFLPGIGRSRDAGLVAAP
ncbi:isoprenylcysteine carboxylmethyltransferase family protein [Geodermatophilus aquaeductus]|uniref:Protein-S-isoprenylcysteine O-methyltransferase Ste14 n=1 Tax=Geodermatophilus aquaeductus TaxID=1564161 RepID=A0A521FJE0_9ACTN|nr:isoprenylcysteine carboxylmethyltransferase family protein [Geodermatophilus aquaeductus]SMO96298.1 Protein-S-isoprenylcysteine O-methyltransferase Ste14 [Geodermatophilus aquaeductus]